MVYGVVSLISISDTLLLVYKNATDFYILVLFPATLLNLLMSSHNFLVIFLGFSVCSIMSPANSDSFTSFFPAGILFICFSSSIATTRNSLVAQMVKNSPVMWETWVWSLRRAWQPTPVFLPGKSPWAEEPGGLQSVGSQRVRHDWVTKHSTAHRTSKTILNKSGVSGYPCLVPDLRGNAFSLSPLSMMLVVSLWKNGLHYVEVCSLCAHFLERFF